MKRLFSVNKSNILIIPICLIANMLMGGGPCLENDHCQIAITISNVISDQSYVCTAGCNEYAAPDSIVAPCQMGDYPTVWYKFVTDAVATILNIEVFSEDFDAPSIAVFKAIAGCGALEQVYLANGNLGCLIGAEGVVKGIGTYVTPSTTYYIAVSSLFSIGGNFQICLSTLSDGSYCVVDRDIAVISRSNGGPLEGPFDPGEKLKICMNVNAYTPVENGCQWFQGIIPSFGNGWDPNSFDTLGQPMNAKVNNINIGDVNNGVYGTATWDWFNDVDYHHDNPRLNIGDYDNNGRFELCNSNYELECQQQNGLLGGCCGPCWDTLGTVLPGGWFAYGINGTCLTPGPPISVDWGDGNSCGSNMGPWSFCFDLVARNTPDCLGDSTKNDLSIGFHTFADGEVGSWTGEESVCALDQPLKLSLKALCGRITRRETEFLPTINSEDVFSYIIDDREIANWEWNISPYWVMPHVINRGENGVVIQNQALNTSGEPVKIKIIFVGHEIGSQDLTIKKVEFTVNPWTTSTTSYYDDKTMAVIPNPAHNKAIIEWPKSIRDAKYLTVYNTQGIVIEHVSILTDNTNTYPLDLTRYSSGLYFINLVTRQKLYSAKLIKN